MTIINDVKVHLYYIDFTLAIIRLKKKLFARTLPNIIVHYDIIGRIVAFLLSNCDDVLYILACSTCTSNRAAINTIMQHICVHLEQ